MMPARLTRAEATSRARVEPLSGTGSNCFPTPDLGRHWPSGVGSLPVGTSEPSSHLYLLCSHCHPNRDSESAESLAHSSLGGAPRPGAALPTRAPSVARGRRFRLIRSLGPSRSSDPGSGVGTRRSPNWLEANREALNRAIAFRNECSSQLFKRPKDAAVKAEFARARQVLRRPSGALELGSESI
jgi:hypothetical protein